MSLIQSTSYGKLKLPNGSHIELRSFVLETKPLPITPDEAKHLLWGQNAPGELVIEANFPIVDHALLKQYLDSHRFEIIWPVPQKKAQMFSGVWHYPISASAYNFYASSTPERLRHHRKLRKCQLRRIHARKHTPQRRGGIIEPNTIAFV